MCSVILAPMFALSLFSLSLSLYLSLALSLSLSLSPSFFLSFFLSFYIYKGGKSNSRPSSPPVSVGRPETIWRPEVT